MGEDKGPAAGGWVGALSLSLCQRAISDLRRGRRDCVAGCRRDHDRISCQKDCSHGVVSFPCLGESGCICLLSECMGWVEMLCFVRSVCYTYRVVYSGRFGRWHACMVLWERICQVPSIIIFVVYVMAAARDPDQKKKSTITYRIVDHRKL